MPSWYALVTRSRHEKSVASQLTTRNVECFLPLYQKSSQWQDRRVRIELPLFPGYVFVRIPLEEKREVLQTSGACRFVGFNGSPYPIEDAEIEQVRTASHAVKSEPVPYIKLGDSVRVIRGPLMGLQGILVRKKNIDRLVVSLELIQRSMAVEIESDWIEAAK